MIELNPVRQRITDLTDYTSVLPYASELFGVYQPLLGWKSAIIQKRYDKFRRRFHERLAFRAMASTRAPVKLSRIECSTDGIAPIGGLFEVDDLKPLNLEASFRRRVSPAM